MIWDYGSGKGSSEMVILRENCPNAELFLDGIFLYSD